jgi:hypothetical protein
MATNGVYFGAEIVRDLTPAPSSRMARGEGEGERGWGGGGLGEGACMLDTHSLSSLTYIPLCPSLSICLCASSLLWLSRSTPPHVCLLLSGQGSRLPALGPRHPCLRVEAGSPG